LASEMMFEFMGGHIYDKCGEVAILPVQKKSDLLTDKGGMV
jgi:hypothetical protein